ncbi:MAG: pentapeptide repeat-containing protein [Gammaproteobacteria bacterium]|nr:pentapeptide repeat-containing protein [Gammaproteobacteria bacterium]
MVVEVTEGQRRAGRELLLQDPEQDRELARFRFGRFPAASARFDLPVDARTLVLELREGETVISRHPESGYLRLEAAATLGSLADSDQEGAPCTTLPPEADEALALWLANCPLEHAPLVSRDLRAVDLTERNLWRADLRNSDLSDARLRHAQLSGASLAGARLDGADLAGARLELADLHGASLFVTDLDGADLRSADLRGADLSHASLSNADLTGARLAGATLDGADFTGAICPDGVRAVSSCRDHLELP